MAPPKTPARLRADGKDLWDSIVPKYELRPDEYRVLADACHEADQIAELETAQESADLITRGSMGQEVISPFISELRQHRVVMANLLKTLKLPDSTAGTQRKNDYTSDKARAAARARWGTAKGA